MKLKNLFNTPKNFELNEYLVLIYRLFIMMVLYGLCRVLFYSLNLRQFPDTSFLDLPLLIIGGINFDLTAILYLNLLFLLLSLVPHPWKHTSGFQAIIKYVFYIFNSIGLAFNCIDIIYYRFIFKRTTASVFSILKNEDNMGALWVQFFIDYWYILALFIGLIWLMIRLDSFIKSKPTVYIVKWKYYPTSVLYLLLAGGLIILGIRGGVTNVKPIGMADGAKYTSSPNELAIVLNTPFCIIRTIGKTKLKRQNFFKDQKELEELFNPVKHYTHNSNFQKKNVVIIILESFNKEYIGALNQNNTNPNYQGYTPFLDSLIKESLVFTNTYANGIKSVDALPAISASIPVFETAFVVSEYSSNNINGLPSILTKEGYSTAFFHGSHNGSMRFDAFAYKVGFQKYYGKDEYNNNDDYDGQWGIFDEPFLDYFGKETSKLKEPFLSSVFTLSSHHPFTIPKKHKGEFPKGPSPFHETIGYVDYSLSLFFKYASQQSWYQNTLFVLVADHSTAPLVDAYKNDKDAFAIPLLFFTPDGSLKGTNNKVAQQADIMPTILDYLGYSKPFIAFGNNLLSNKKSFSVNFKNNNYQLTTDSIFMRYDGKEIHSAYNYIEDPGLTRNIRDKKSIAQEKNYLFAFIQQYNNRMIDNELAIK